MQKIQTNYNASHIYAKKKECGIDQVITLIKLKFSKLKRDKIRKTVVIMFYVL